MLLPSFVLYIEVKKKSNIEVAEQGSKQGAVSFVALYIYAVIGHLFHCFIFSHCRQIMKVSKGLANPALVNKILKQKLDEATKAEGG